MADWIRMNAQFGWNIGNQRSGKQEKSPRSGTAIEEQTEVFDSFSVENGWKEKAEIEKAVQNFFNELRKNSSGITIWTENQGASGRDVIADLADEMGNGIYLVVSDSFLESMKAGGESFKKKSEILLQVMHKLSMSCKPQMTVGAYLDDHQAVFWKVSDRQDDANSRLALLNTAQENTASNPYGETVNSLRLRSTCGPISYNTAAAYAKLAHAKSKAAVQSVMQQTQRQIASLRLLVSFSSGEEAEKAKAALRSYQKLLLRGNTKIRQLSEAHLTELKKERAVEKQEKEKAEFWADQARRNKVSRNIRDGALIKEGQLEQLQIPGYHKKRTYWEESFPMMSQMTVSPVPISSAGTGTSTLQSAEEVFSVVGIQIF